MPPPRKPASTACPVFPVSPDSTSTPGAIDEDSAPLSSAFEQFSTGAVRDNQQDKPRYDLIPPAALRLLADHYTRGAQFYRDSQLYRSVV